jgi:hypothetical protein
MKRRPIAKLRESLEQQAAMYALAASAAGVSLLATAVSADAKVIYTKTNINLPVNTALPLDLNHDGITDFSLSLTAGSYHSLGVFVIAEPANQVAGYCERLSQGCWASAIRPGARVGPRRRFGPYRDMLFGGCSSTCDGFGPWDNVQHRYLGFEFLIKGKVHYGWARLNVSVNDGAVGVLTGYAYETIPNKPLVTGKTKGPEVIKRESTTLGHLASGASVIREP